MSLAAESEIVSNETGAVFKFGSRVAVTLVVGFPVLFPPFEKRLFARMPLAGHKDATLVSSLLFLPLLILTGGSSDCDSFEVDQRVFLCSSARVYAADGAPRSTWRLAFLLMIHGSFLRSKLHIVREPSCDHNVVSWTRYFRLGSYLLR